MWPYVALGLYFSSLSPPHTPRQVETSLISACMLSSDYERAILKALAWVTDPCPNKGFNPPFYSPNFLYDQKGLFFHTPHFIDQGQGLVFWKVTQY